MAKSLDGRWLSTARESKNLTQFEMASILLVSEDAVRRWEAGSRGVSIPYAREFPKRLADGGHPDLADKARRWLKTGTGPPKKQKLANPTKAERIRGECLEEPRTPAGVEIEREKPPASTSAENESPVAQDPSPAAPPQPSEPQIILRYLEEDLGAFRLRNAVQAVLQTGPGDPMLLRYLDPVHSRKLEWEYPHGRLRLFKEIIGAAEGIMAAECLHPVQRPPEVREALRNVTEVRVDKLLRWFAGMFPDVFPPVPGSSSMFAPTEATRG